MTTPSSAIPEKPGRAYLVIAALLGLFSFVLLLDFGAKSLGFSGFGRTEGLIQPLGFGIGSLFALEAAWRAAGGRDAREVDGASRADARPDASPLAGAVFIVGNGAARTRVALDGGRLLIEVGPSADDPVSAT